MDADALKTNLDSAPSIIHVSILQVPFCQLWEKLTAHVGAKFLPGNPVGNTIENTVFTLWCLLLIFRFRSVLRARKPIEVQA
jgi:hypothetical protein